MEHVVPNLRCPAAGLPEHVADCSAGNRLVKRRVPVSYTANCSGTITSDRSDDDDFWDDLDGPFVRGKQKRPDRFERALSGIVYVGEVWQRDPVDSTKNQKEDHTNRLGTVGVGSNFVPAYKDHWAIGGDDPHRHRDMSEALGSTGCRLNLPPVAPSTDSAQREAFEEYEMGYGSAHPGGQVNLLMGDGSVIAASDDIDPDVFSKMGQVDD